MRIELLVQAPMRVWHVRLAEALVARGHRVHGVAGGQKRPTLRTITAAMGAEKKLFRLGPSLFDAVSNLPAASAEDRDLSIALDRGSETGDHVLTPFFDGVAGEDALLQAVACSPAPSVELRVGREPERVLVRARLAIEDRDVFSRALDSVLARVSSLILQAVQRFEKGADAGQTVLSEPVPKRRSDPRWFVARGVARKVARRLSGTGGGTNHWRIGFRRLDGVGVAETLGWSGSHYATLPDDGRRFYADPVPFENDGRTYLFFEDFPYASGKGVIGAVELSADGGVSPLGTVLEQPVHLSYPFLLRHGGEIYMLPETSGAGRVQLFRAKRFPDRWVPDRILLDGVVASDATPVFHDGRWWLFATLSDDGGSTWDQLGLFHAPDLLGPWSPYRDNPVLVDAGAARPAGAMWVAGGKLMRVAQDCRTGYGVGLAICRVDRLDEAGFAQTLVARLSPPAGYGADGVHTLNRAGGLEVIDLRFPSSAPVRRRGAPVSKSDAMR